MKTFIIAATLCMGVAAQTAASDLLTLADRLSRINEFRATADHEILLPTADEPMTYSLDLLADTVSADTLAPVNYLITWRLDRKADIPDGFAAYFSGNLYQFRDQRLREHHFSDNPQTFIPCGDPRHGIQNHMQFVNLLPQYISRTFRDMAADSTYKYIITDTVIGDSHVLAVNIIRSYKGEKAATYTYAFDSTSLLPIRSETVSNPGTGNEQAVTTTYSLIDGRRASSKRHIPTDEKSLAELFPDIFSNFRESSLTPAGMKGRLFPPFSLPTTTGERYTLDKGREFARPTVIVLLDAESPETPGIIATLRQAACNTGGTDIIMAFVNNNTDLIENAAGPIRIGEHMLISAHGLARTCGATELPVIFYCNSTTKITDISQGINNAADDVVIQKAALIAD